MRGAPPPPPVIRPPNAAADHQFVGAQLYPGLVDISFDQVCVASEFCAGLFFHVKFCVIGAPC